MPVDYAEKEREFLSSLEADTGRDLAGWMAAISAQDLGHRNDIIDWLRQQGFMFWKASWLERIQHNRGRPIYADAEPPKPSVERSRAPAKPAAPIREAKPETPPPPAPKPATEPELDELLARAKAYRPLALYLLREIGRVVPGARIEAASGYISASAPQIFAVIVPGPRDVRLGVAGPITERGKFGPIRLPAGGPAIPKTITHMAVLTDAREIDEDLLRVVRAAAENAAP